MKPNKILLILIISALLVVVLVVVLYKYYSREKNISQESVSEILQPYTPNFPPSLPNISELTTARYYTNVALLNLYFIQIACYIGGIEFTTNLIDKVSGKPVIDIANEYVKEISNSFNVVKLLLYNNKTTTYGGIIVEYIYNNNKIIFIAFRGTGNINDVQSDISSILTTANWLNNTIKVHSGFNSMYVTDSTNASPTLRSQIQSYLKNINNINTNIFISGHSLGGALANLVFADISANYTLLRPITKLYMYASAGIGDQNFINLIAGNYQNNYTGIFCIQNNFDPVAQSSKLLSYATIPTQNFCFEDTGNGIFGTCHFLIYYERGLRRYGNLFDSNASKNLASCGIPCSRPCQYNTITDSAICGVNTIVDGTICGWDYTTDGVICGWNFTTNGIKCGWDYVSNAPGCISQIVDAKLHGKNINQNNCPKCYLAKTCKDTPKSCINMNSPKSCNALKS